MQLERRFCSITSYAECPWYIGGPIRRDRSTEHLIFQRDTERRHWKRTKKKKKGQGSIASGDYMEMIEKKLPRLRCEGGFWMPRTAKRPRHSAVELSGTSAGYCPVYGIVGLLRKLSLINDRDLSSAFVKINPSTLA